MLFVLSGCFSTNRELDTDTNSSSTLVSEIPTPTISAGHIEYEGFHYDSPKEDESLSTAMQYAEDYIKDVILYSHIYDEATGQRAPNYLEAVPTLSASLFPQTQTELLQHIGFFLVPVFEYSDLDKSATDLFAITHPQEDSYILCITYKNELIGSTGFHRFGGKANPFYSFYGDLSGPPSLLNAQSNLRNELGDGQILVRIIGVPRGYWVVGYSNGREVAFFEQHNGSYNDDPHWNRAYSVKEVLEYGEPHGSPTE